MEKQKTSDIEVAVKFGGIASAEDVPDFEFSFYTELHHRETYTCGKTGSKLMNCVVSEIDSVGGMPYCEVKCMLENHNFKRGRLCVLAHIKWTDPDYKDGVKDDVYREKLDLYVNN
jgi:hypothetical protein